MSDHEHLTLYKRPPFGKCQRPGAFIGVNTVLLFRDELQYMDVMGYEGR